ncbi:MAG: TspO/MBR family protein [Aminipila sp.]
MKNIKSLAIFIAIPLILGGISALISGGNAELYSSIVLPKFAPPSYIFPIAWTILYILMGISSFLIYKSSSPYRKEALKIYVIQLLVNFIWSPIFFGAQMYGLAFIVLILLWVLVALMIIKFYEVEPCAAYLQIPYFLWLTFAGYLNLFVYLLNR